MTLGYHYVNCGLDYVYLRNGYREVETPHGRGVAIADARGLHEAIALAIVTSPRPIRGQEVRFLRAQLKLSQEGLAHIIGVRRGAVARWEGRPGEAIPGPADTSLRAFYALKARKDELADRVLRLLEEIDARRHGIEAARDATFRETDSGWECDRAA